MSATPEQIAVELDDLANSALVPAYHDDLRTAASLIRSLNERVERLNKELRYYADEYCEGWCHEAPAAACFDDCGGCFARAALERK